VAARFVCELPFGAQVTESGVRFRVWAPGAADIAVALETPAGDRVLPFARRDGGWFELETREAQPGTRYRFQLGDGFRVPDPASRFQPAGVHAASQVVNPKAYAWQNGAWRGRPWEETVLYEAHLGCFSPEGSFDGARRRLDHLVGLGVTALELMPIAAFEGRRNWGYDGVLPFAPAAAYGTPDQLKQLIDEAHGRNLMMFLDVVYNHFGPSGNYLGRYAGGFFTDRHRTPWGDAINFDGADSRPVRDFFIYNALYWLEEFRFDGLRLDAVHAIRDDSRPDILEEIATTVRARLGGERRVHLVLENDNNAARYLARDKAGGIRHYTAQWNDDFHHAAHVAATGEKWGYYQDYVASTPAALARALAEGFVYQGETSAFRQGRRRGEPSAHLPPTAFVAFLQNHDQVGNRAFGERLATLMTKPPCRMLTAILLLAPQIPMLFMGEEWGAQSPFLFFCDFAGELAAAVREGRRREFSHLPAFRDHLMQARIPDPNAAETFDRSRLDWAEPERPDGRECLAFVRRLLALRREAIVPLLAGVDEGRSSHEASEDGAFRVVWRLKDDALLHLVANPTARGVRSLSWILPGRRLYAWPEDFSAGRELRRLPPWSACFALEREMGAS